MKESEELPPNTKTFQIEVAEGDTTRQRYVGKFTCKCVLTIGERTAADLLESRLNEGRRDLREQTQVMHLVLAQLEARLTQAPKWWIASNGGRDLKDENVIADIYGQCMLAESEWKKSVWGEPETAISTVEETEDETEDETEAKKE